MGPCQQNQVCRLGRQRSGHRPASSSRMPSQHQLRWQFVRGPNRKPRHRPPAGRRRTPGGNPASATAGKAGPGGTADMLGKGPLPPPLPRQWPYAGAPGSSMATDGPQVTSTASSPSSPAALLVPAARSPTTSAAASGALAAPSPGAAAGPSGGASGDRPVGPSQPAQPEKPPAASNTSAGDPDYGVVTIFYGTDRGPVVGQPPPSAFSGWWWWTACSTVLPAGLALAAWRAEHRRAWVMGATGRGWP